MLKRSIENFLGKATDWLFRAQAIEWRLLKLSFYVLVAVFAGPPLIAVILRLGLGVVPEGYLQAQRALDVVDGWILIICSAVILVALVLVVCRFITEAKNRSRKRIIVVEGRGLRDGDGKSLEEAVSGRKTGQLIPIFLDLRNRTDGRFIEPEQALVEISAAHRSVLQHQGNVDRSDLTTIYGGLTPVPYTFLTGVLLDDEGAIEIYDWDRAHEEWRAVEGEDDGLAFQSHDLDIPANATEVVLAITFSYPVEDVDLMTTFSLPVARLSLDGMSSNAHWSERKQTRLALEFLEVVKNLSEQGVRRIHLVMAAPNSVVFTFGRRYDKRNLPELVVYQYQRGESPAYPWGVRMPVAGLDQPEVFVPEPIEGKKKFD